MTDLATQKSALRKQAFAARKAAHQADPGTSAQHLSAFLAGHRGVPIAGYMPIRTEIDPRPAMEEAAAHGPVGVPVIMGEGQPLRFSLWEPDMPMKDGPFGAKIPEADHWMTPEIIILPLVAFDPFLNRLGYGGGFYDRTLAQLRKNTPVLAVGFAYAAQQLGSIPTDPTDIPLDMLISDQGLIQTTPN